MSKFFSPRINSRYLSFLLKHNRKMIIVLTLLFSYFIPFTFYTTNRHIQYEFSTYTYVYAPFIVGTIIFILLSVIIPCILMSFIMDRSKMDTYQTLPIRKQDFFLNHFIEALLVLLIPISIAWIAGIVVGYAMFPYEFDVMTWLLNLVKIYLFAPLLIGITQFAYVNSGRFFDGILYSGIVHITQFFTFGLITVLFNERLLGLHSYLDNRISSILSPDISFVTWVNGEFNFAVIIWILAGIALYFVNQHLYTNRKVENIDDSAVYPWFVPLITTIVFGLFTAFFFMLFLPYTGIFNSLILPFVFGLIFYVIMDGIINRGFQNLYKAIGKYALISVCAIALIYSSIFTGFFGLTKQVLSPNQFDKVLIVTESYGVKFDDDKNRITTKEALSLVDGAKEMEDLLNRDGYLFFSHLYESEADKERVVTAHKMVIEDYYSKSNPLQYSRYNIDYVDGKWHNSTANNYPTNFHFIYIKDNRVVHRRNYYMYTVILNEFMNPND